MSRQQTFVYIALDCSPADYPSSFVSAHTSSAVSPSFQAHGFPGLQQRFKWERGISYAIHPPPFNCDSAVGERRCNDTDEDRLSDIKDMVSSNFHVMFDLYGNSNNEVGHHP